MARHCLSGVFLLLCMVSLAHAEGTPTGAVPIPSDQAGPPPEPGDQKLGPIAEEPPRPKKKPPIANAAPPFPAKKPLGQTGMASWYGGTAHGKQTASGDTFDKTAMTAAHRTLPLYSQARVTNVANGRSVTVLVTDRGPASRNRIIDLSESAAMQIGMRHRGIARVRVEPILASAE